MYDAWSDENSVEKLVGKVKALQRTDHRVKEQWTAHCNNNGEGVRDPARHTAEFLQAFLAAVERGHFPEKSASASSSKIFIGGLPDHCDDARLMNQFKAYGTIVECQVMPDRGFGFIVFSSPNAADQVLQDSNQHLIDGVWCDVKKACSLPEQGLDKDLPALFKIGQRKSPAWKEVWSMYCQTYGGGVNDPAKHEASFLVGLLDFLGQRGAMALEHAELNQGGAYMYGEPAAKRMRLTGNPEKDALVAKIKEFQRQGEAQKEQWGIFCDLHTSGIRDPTRHDCETLNLFIGQVESGQFGPGYSLSSPKQELVMQVKAWQRQGGDKLEQWHHFADTSLGGIRDPARHDASQLQQFLALHADPGSQF